MFGTGPHLDSWRATCGLRTTDIDAFKQIGDRRIYFKTKVRLILCVFSGADVGSKWRLLYSLLHPTTKHLDRLIGDILSSPATEVESSQLTQGGSKVRRPCQSTSGSGLCRTTSFWQESQNSLIWERGGSTGWIFIIIGWIFTHTSNTHLCSNNLNN